eukprot:TRINITY_DN16418_c0_g1_i2.p1 TRINITY_DN16418_c0_g1~~TRINITY_DN16418_c0_g1_i2.p1  ORF type:complete len:451 (+),score=75.42 TRINITY_DN16418_c0_g1_i2:52-1404(+)
MSLSPRSKLSRVTAADLASENDMMFKCHGKFQRRSASFSSSTPRFKAKQVHAPGPASYSIRGGGGRAAFLDTRAERGATSKLATDSMYYIEPEWKGKATNSLLGSAGFASNTPRGIMRFSDAPDPTRYQPDQTMSAFEQREASASFRSKSPRLKNERTYTPSPQAYSVSLPKTEAHSHTAAFASTAPRLSERESKTPPPGSHEIPSTFTKAASKGNGTNSFRSRSPRMSHSGNDIPAPGTYEVTPAKSTKGGIMSKSPRTKIRLTHSPGPTAYSLPSSVSKTPATSAFRSSSSRFQEDRPKLDAAYDVKGNDWGNSKGGAFTSMAPRMSTRYDDTPGPGMYTVQPAKSQRGGIMSKSKRPTQRSYTPGPGTYTVGGIGDTSARGATAAFRSTSARGTSESYAPGPGTHFVGSGLSTKGGRMVSKSERFKMVPNDTPAPGHSISYYSSFLE